MLLSTPTAQSETSEPKSYLTHLKLALNAHATRTLDMMCARLHWPAEADGGRRKRVSLPRPCSWWAASDRPGRPARCQLPAAARRSSAHSSGRRAAASCTLAGSARRHTQAQVRGQRKRWSRSSWSFYIPVQQRKDWHSSSCSRPGSERTGWPAYLSLPWSGCWGHHGKLRDKHGERGTYLQCVEKHLLHRATFLHL